ncbi:hypothetical protein GDO81_020086 [Engystomops pustulosus]|uniref:Uncharacterized protein n=1 Tax=Engystomops pustulosus TaxID=76066 RepID=A0AAV6ZQE6_ENGPU|nr:hypothetical protein GDO81_020086 [Engystomops pustulosus]
MGCSIGYSSLYVFYALSPIRKNTTHLTEPCFLNIRICAEIESMSCSTKYTVEQQMNFRPHGWPLPRPDYIHHVVEDFLTDWTSPNSHILPLRRFLENCLQKDLRTFYADSCFLFSMTHQKLPTFCEQVYLQNQGLKKNIERS